jgi:hypothetical protein
MPTIDYAQYDGCLNRLKVQSWRNVCVAASGTNHGGFSPQEGTLQFIFDFNLKTFG